MTGAARLRDPRHRRVGGREGSALLCRVPTGQRPVHHVAGGPADPFPLPGGFGGGGTPGCVRSAAPHLGDGPSPGGDSGLTAAVLGRREPRGLGVDAGPSLARAHSGSLSVPQFPPASCRSVGPSVAGLATARCREGTGRGGARSCHRDRTFAWGLRGGVFLGSGVSVPFGRGPRRHSMPGLRSTFWVLFPAVSLRDPSPPTFSVSCDR